MALIGRLFVILFAFLAACLVAGSIVVVAVLFPEFSDLGTGPVDPGAFNIVLGFGFIFISGFALLPAMIVAAITEAFYVRSALAYAVGAAWWGLPAISASFHSTPKRCASTASCGVISKS
jgi:hypothetical protein